jgi:23S rRNA (guanosine2251-2'-O)-methyltransferase
VDSPRARSLTLYGRRPVLEALEDLSLPAARLHVSERAQGLGPIVAAATTRGIPVERVRPERVARISGNGRQDQGVALDLAPPGFETLAAFLARPYPERAAAGPLFVCDGITTPANLGLVIRSVTAAGGAVVVPDRGTARLGPLVVKASAGTILRATVLRSATAAQAVGDLTDAGFLVAGLDARAPRTLWEAELAPPLALVLGGETAGLSREVQPLLHDKVALPLAGGVESLNVACAATAVAFELVRRSHARPA